MTLLPILIHVAFPLYLLSTAAAATPPAELLCLLSIKSSLKDPLNTFRDWDPATAFSRARAGPQPEWCSWSGIECDRRTHQVTTLDLSGRNLSGSISRDIKYLLHLHYLNLSRNSFDGPLQTTLFDLPNLTILDINHNLFNSSFSPGISKLKSLTTLNAFSNSFAGPLPEELVGLGNLEYLNLGGSYFNGEIPSSYGGFPRLKYLYLHGNSLSGRIPAELGFLKQLQHLELGYNSYAGGVPAQLSSLSNLVYLDISSANLSGNLPPEFGRLVKLETLLLFKNNFTGSIPATWAQMRSLQVVDLSFNNLSGEIPSGFAALKELIRLSLMNNKLTGEIPQGIGELPNLEILFLWNNSFSGILPQSLGSNSRLQWLDVSSNSLTGPIPPNLCRGGELWKLLLFSNQFVGEIPSSLANCKALYRVRIQGNHLNGSIPFGFGSMPNLTYLELSNNRLSAPIPKDLGNAVRLQLLDISGNSFNSELPGNIWESPNLQILRAGSANINGVIPNFIGCSNIYRIELDRNNLSGGIPSEIGRCMKLISLDLSGNALTGTIPSAISTLPAITDVDLSHNSLRGTIPPSFSNCRTLLDFNVSYNQLTGAVPSSGLVFPSLHPSSFAGNEGLCGGVLKKPCPTEGTLEAAAAMEVRQQPKKTGGGTSVIWITAAGFGIGLFILIAGARWFHSRKVFNAKGGDGGPWKLTAFQRVGFTAEEVVECVKTSDEIIGMGSAGTVYKAEMRGGEIIAVKMLWGSNKDDDVVAEVEVLGSVRHRNIVRLLGWCSNNARTMLLYEYMPNGSLEDLLHGKEKENLVRDWVTRYKIALGVAQGICYLHHDCNPVIVHRDLKPSNILLDAQMEARLADFGVAKLLHTHHSLSMSVIAGSYGYIAPEYAYTLQVDEKSDIYSYGVVLLEILTGRRSVESEFGDGNSIVDWVKSKMKTKNGLFDVLGGPVREEVMLLLRVALLCTSRNPGDRPSMRDVVSMLLQADPKRKFTDHAGSFAATDHTGYFLDPKKPPIEC